MFESKPSFKRLAEEAHKLRKKVANIKEQATETVGHVKQTLEVGALTFGLSYANGVWADKDTGEFDVAGAPVDLTVGLVLHGLAFFGATGKYGEDAHNFGDGALAAYLARKGRALGDKAKAEGGFFKQTGISGIPRAPGQEVPVQRAT